MSNSHTSSHSLALADRGRLDSPSATGRRRVVAITGAAQFLGSNLIGLLEEDPSVRSIVCLDAEAPQTAGAKSRVYNVNLTEALAEERMAEILSAEARPRPRCCASVAPDKAASPRCCASRRCSVPPSTTSLRVT